MFIVLEGGRSMKESVREGCSKFSSKDKERKNATSFGKKTTAKKIKADR